MTPAGDGYDEAARREASAGLRQAAVLFAVIGLAVGGFLLALDNWLPDDSCDGCFYKLGDGRHPQFDPQSYYIFGFGGTPSTHDAARLAVLRQRGEDDFVTGRGDGERNAYSPIAPPAPSTRATAPPPPPYTCRAEISGYQNADGETPAAGAASIEVVRSEQVINLNRRYSWRSKTIAVVIETAAAAASGEVIFDPNEGLGSFASPSTGAFSVYAWVDVPEPSAEWSLTCEPYEAP